MGAAIDPGALEGALPCERIVGAGVKEAGSRAAAASLRSTPEGGDP